MQVRCSSLPLIATCPAASVEPSVSIRTQSAEADLGSAAHEAIRARVERGGADLSAIAKAWSCEPDDLGYLAHAGMLAWEQLRQWFPEPKFEVELELSTMHGGKLAGTGVHVTLSGHLDVLSEPPGVDEARVIDWKSGRLDSGWQDQVKGYALLATTLKKKAKARCAVVRLRELTVDWFTWTRMELEEWFITDLVPRLAADNKTYNPGLHCSYCPRSHECPAKTALLQDAIAVLLTKGGLPDGSEKSYDAGLVTAMKRIRLIEAFIKKVAPVIKAQVIEAGGKVEDGKDHALQIVTREYQYLRPGVAWPMLYEMLGDQLIDCVKLAKDKIVDLVRAAAPYRGKKAAVDALLAKLEQAGALATFTQERLEIRRVPKSLPPQPKGIALIEGDNASARYQETAG